MFSYAHGGDSPSDAHKPACAACQAATSKLYFVVHPSLGSLLSSGLICVCSFRAIAKCILWNAIWTGSP